MRRIAMVGALAVSAFACGPTPPHVHIGAILSQTGMLATSGQDHLEAVQLAVDEINVGGGVIGAMLDVTNVDDRSDPAGAGAAATELADRGVPAIIGAITSDATLAAAAVVTAREVVLMSGGATSPALSGYSPWFFRTCPPDSLQGQLLAKRAVARGYSRAAVLFIPGAYGEKLAQAFVSNFTALGGTVAFDQEMMTGQASYHDLLAQAFATNPQAVLLIAYPVDAAQVVRDYVSAFAFHQAFWFFTDSTQDSSFITAVGGNNFTFAHEGTGPAPGLGEGYPRFANAFTARFGRAPEGHSPDYYDATYLIALAMQKGGKAEGAAIRDNLRSVSSPPGLVVGPQQWATARLSLLAGTDVDYNGAGNNDDLNADGDVIGPYDLWDVENGQITITQHGVSP
jgi:neutral amino acid transport system substrate-binding protein